jgi:ABC-type multidrug transport system ATPase subunit
MTIDLLGVSARRGRTPVLHDISVSLTHPVTTIMGPNGAGKTTLLHVLAGLVGHSGSVRLGARPLRFPEALSWIGYAPQSIEWPGRLSVRDVCELAAHLRDVPRAECASRVEAALDAAGLSDLASRRVSTLSGGQRRRLSLAQALVHTPRLLLLDEPTSELDPLFCESFAVTLSDLSTRHHVIVTTHSIDDVARWPGEVLLISRGAVTVIDGAEALSPEQRAAAVRSAFHRVA